jgi:hypothetical protein
VGTERGFGGTRRRRRRRRFNMVEGGVVAAAKGASLGGCCKGSNRTPAQNQNVVLWGASKVRCYTFLMFLHHEEEASSSSSHGVLGDDVISR